MKNERAINPLEEHKTLRKIEDDMIGHIEKVTRAFGVPRTKAILAKAKVSDAVQIMIGTRNAEKTRQLDPKSKENVLKLVDELGSGRTCILLLRKEDGSGVVEMMSGKEYKFA